MDKETTKSGEPQMSIEEALAQIAPTLSPKDRKKQAEVIEKALMEGVPLKESLGISSDSIEFFYSEGYRLFLLRKYEEALKYFRLLYLLNGSDPRFAFGIAASYHKQKDFQNALSWYLTLATLDDTSPMPFYYMSDCFLKLGDTEFALDFLKKSVELAEGNFTYKELKERMLRAITALEKHLEKEVLK